MRVMSIEQERVMRNLESVGICRAQAKLFAVHAGPDAFSLMQAVLRQLNDVYAAIEAELPEDHAENINQFPFYAEEVDYVERLFQGLYKRESLSAILLQEVEQGISKTEYAALQTESVELEMEIAKGQDTPNIDSRLCEVNRLMDASPWIMDMDSHEIVDRSILG